MGVSSSSNEGVVADLFGGGDNARLGGRALFAWAAMDERAAGPTTTAGEFMACSLIVCCQKYCKYLICHKQLK